MVDSRCCLSVWDKQSGKLPNYLVLLSFYSSHFPSNPQAPLTNNYTRWLKSWFSKPRSVVRISNISILTSMLSQSSLGNFLTTHNVNQIQFLVDYIPNTNPEVWVAKIGHFYGFGQNMTYLEAHGETTVQAYKNLLRITANVAAQSQTYETETGA